MNNELTYKAKDGVEYKYTIKELTLAIKPVWNKILHAINKQKKFFISQDDLKITTDYEKRIIELQSQLELAEINCKNADIPGRTEADEKVLSDFIKIHDEIDIKLTNLKAEKLESAVCRDEMTNFINGIILSIENALLEDENIYKSCVNLIEGDISKLDLLDENCFNEVIRPAVVAFFLKRPSN